MNYTPTKFISSQQQSKIENESKAEELNYILKKQKFNKFNHYKEFPNENKYTIYDPIIINGNKIPDYI